MEPAAPSVDIGTYITRIPGFKDGEPIIAGTGVRVRRVACYYKMGHTAEDLVRELPHLTPGQIYAALAYYHANPAEIDAAIEQESEDYDRLVAEHLAEKQLAK